MHTLTVEENKFVIEFKASRSHDSSNNNKKFCFIFHNFTRETFYESSSCLPSCSPSASFLKFFLLMKSRRWVPNGLYFIKQVSFSSFTLVHTLNLCFRWTQSKRHIFHLWTFYQPLWRLLVPNEVNSMQNLWDSTSFPDANYHVVCHIMPQCWKKKEKERARVCFKV